MKKYLVLATLISVGFFPTFAAADGEEKPKPEKQAGADVKVETFSITVGSDSKVEVTGPKSKKESSPETKAEALGKVIVIGPDGKIDVKDLKGGLPKDILDKLPEDLRKKMQKEPSGGHISGKMKVIIDKDGKRQEFESDLGGAGDMKGLLSGDIGEILKKAGEKLPPEAKQALDAAAQEMKAKGKKLHGPAADPSDVGAKLDEILSHLKRLEKEVQELKAKMNK